MAGIESDDGLFERAHAGRRLRELRESKGLTLEAASEATHVKVRYLAALEREDIESLLGAAYAKSFLKAYARLLEADEALVDDYKELIRSRRHVERVSYGTESGGRVMGGYPLLGAAGIAAVVIIAVLLSTKNRDQEPSPDGSFVSAQQHLSADTSAHDSTSLPMAEPITPPELTLEIVALDTTWAEIIMDGRTRRSETLNPGEIRLLDAKREFAITLGNAGGVELRLNGRKLPPLGARGAVVRDAVITRDNLAENS